MQEPPPKRPATTYRVTVLTPIHIGTGQRLTAQDFYLDYQGRTFTRVRPEAVFAAVAEEERALALYLQGGVNSLPPTLQQRVLQERLYRCRLPSPLAAIPHSNRPEVKEYIAAAWYRPYLPGSSVKGAIRTAVAWAALQRQPQALRRHVLTRRIDGKPKPTEVDTKLQQALAGQDQHYDIFRALRVEDTMGVPAQAALRIYALAVVAPDQGQHRLTWMVRGRSRQGPSQYHTSRERAAPTLVEAFAPGRELRLTVSQDTVLLRAANMGGKVDGEMVGRWAEHCNAFAKHVAEGEVQRWRGVTGMETYVGFYTDLLHQIERADRSVFLNLGWGGGWRGKTITEAFGTEMVDQVVRGFNLDRGSRSRPFPKTRRVVVMPDNRLWPLGWIRLEPL